MLSRQVLKGSKFPLQRVALLSTNAAAPAAGGPAAAAPAKPAEPAMTRVSSAN